MSPLFKRTPDPPDYMPQPHAVIVEPPNVATPAASALASDEWERTRFDLRAQDAQRVAAFKRGAITTPVTQVPPTQPGVYWAIAPDGSIKPAVVHDFGGRMCLRYHSQDGTTWRNVSTFPFMWSGPWPLPEGYTLDQIDAGLRL